MSPETQPADRAAVAATNADGYSRRSIFGLMSTGLLAAAGLCLTRDAEAAVSNPTDRAILNFALNLEYLEAEFYLYATTGMGLPADLTSGLVGAGKSHHQGAGGPTTGGSQVTFADTYVTATANQITVDEVDHVKLLRSVLGKDAVAKPPIKLDALGIGFASESEFLLLARAFEDTGVSAYSGAAPLISHSRAGKTILGVAARILATETYHAGNIRLQVVQKGLTSPATDNQDIPPTLDHLFTVDDTTGLAVVRTTGQVIDIVKPFFPSGIYGPIQS